MTKKQRMENNLFSSKVLSPYILLKHLKESERSNSVRLKQYNLRVPMRSKRHLAHFHISKEFLNWVLPSRNGSETYKFKGRTMIYWINILSLIARTCEQWLFSSGLLLRSQRKFRLPKFLDISDMMVNRKIESML